MDITGINSQRLSAIHPKIAERANEFISQCSDTNIPILITQGLRTWAEQDALYAQGRTTAGKIVTNARGGQSYHNFGLAFDFVPLTTIGKADWDTTHPDWITVIQIGKNIGFESGSDWKFKDMPHLQIAGGMTLSQLQTLIKQSGLQACWDELDKLMNW